MRAVTRNWHPVWWTLLSTVLSYTLMLFVIAVGFFSLPGAFLVAS
ncbi:MAG: hypothetical protein ACOCUO_03565 [archaeon]